ncbi:MAG: V-type ATP synthase subunit D [Bacteroidales bacterium]|jgi:V/A-type H+-transporting ATPase subunit D|nr:V-type ATP synthase subunit D [Bacteroidales bacterium]
MKIQIKYNKTALRELQKKLASRKKALPTLKSKEAALRALVTETGKELERLKSSYSMLMDRLEPWKILWEEFDEGLVTIKEVKSGIMKIAGIKVPQFEGLTLEVSKFSMVGRPVWFLDGVVSLEDALKIRIEKEMTEEKYRLLDHARKRAKQKVNLYEKVQIPAISDAIRNIKRYLEDEENLAKSSQKLLKNRLNAMEETTV